MIKHVYAIRQKSTGFFLPQERRNGSKYTSVTPKANCLPRIFHRISDAKKCLEFYVRGELQLVAWYEYGEGTRDYVYLNGTQRNIEDFEIVEGKLTLSNFNNDEQLRLQNNNNQLTAWLSSDSAND